MSLATSTDKESQFRGEEIIYASKTMKNKKIQIFFLNKLHRWIMQKK